MISQYAELQVTTNFSFLRGASHPQELIRRAAELGYRAVAVTDLHTMAGIIRAHAEAKECGMPLVVGARVHPRRTAEAAAEHLPLSILLYATDKASYGRLTTLLTTGKLRAPKGECYLTLDDIVAFQNDLLAVAVLHDPHRQEIPTLLRALRETFSDDRLSLALSSTYSATYRVQEALVASLAKNIGIPLVAVNDVYYHIAERRILQDVLTCIRLGSTIESAGYALHANAERYLKPPAEMHRLFRSHPGAVNRTLAIAERAARFSLSELRYEYPQEVCPDGMSPQEYLRELVIDGMRRHYPGGVPKEVLEQIRHEMQIIRELQYEKYFLTVYDIVRFARSRGILCQGRGAAANSAICYVLGITAVDPSQIRLLFERFISKERNEPPDIDIDFEHERREEVIQYIYNRYGRMRAALTAEAICYRSRSSVRDVGKVFGLAPEAIDTLVRIKTRDSLRLISDERVQELGLDPSSLAVQHTIALSETLRTFPRHLSQHVGGFIISDPPLCEISPIENAAMPDRTTIEWDKDDIEELGILKIDVLGLGMLTCIRKGMDLINRHRLHKVNGSVAELTLHSMPREDPAVYDMICRAETIGVFQIESRAQMAMLPRMRPRCFYDLVVEVAIVRPGPIQGGMVHPYLRRRQGLERATYPDERIKKILGQTLGVPIFQEQVMELAVIAAGFTPGESDRLRRAMASWRKDVNALLRFEKRVKDGMMKGGYSAEFAHQVFEQMKGFGEYGFPQSHSASFAILVYASAWLKCHYPAVFAAALLNSQPMGFYQPAQIVEDAKRAGVQVLRVDVNASEWDCTLERTERGDLGLRLGMRMVRGLREAEAEKIVKARTPGRSLLTVLSLWRASRIRVDQLRKLVRADAFQSMNLGRQEAMWQTQRLRDDHLPLFDAHEDAEPEVSLPLLSERIEVYRDYGTVGLSLRAHPVSFLRKVLDAQGVVTAATVRGSPNGKRLLHAGLVLVRQRPGTAGKIIFMTVEDETGMANLIVKPEIEQAYLDAIHDSTIILVRGRVQREGEVVHLLVDEAIDISGTVGELHAESRDFH